MMNKKANIALVASALFLTISAHAQQVSGDADLKKQLIGKWSETRQFDCETHTQTTQLHANGRFSIQGNISFCNVTEKIDFKFTGKWNVKDGMFIYQIMSIYPKGLYAPEAFHDLILSVTKTDWLMKEESTGNLSRATRY